MSSIPPHHIPKPEAHQVPWGKYMISLYVGQKGPQPLGTVVFSEIEQKARKKLAAYPGAFLYAGGSAGTCQTEHANEAYLRSLRIIPRMLKPTNTRSLGTTLFGIRYPSPMLIAPIGVQGTFYEDGELAPARAAGKLGVPFVCSTASTRSIEQVAKANDEFANVVLKEGGQVDLEKGAAWNLSLIGAQPEGGALASRWYQLYWPIHNEVTSSLLSRARASGYTTLVITLDTMSLGWRPHDLERSYLPFGLGVGIEIGRSDPVFMSLHNRQPPKEDYVPKFPYLPQDLLSRAMGLAGTPEEHAQAKEDAYLGQAWLAESNSGTYRSWEDLDFILDEWKGPVVLKGIQSVRDAEKAAEVLMKDGREGGIVVSNHGGRQVDGAIPSILALQRILASKKVQAARNPPPGSNQKKFHVLFDSGIRTGSDILKAVMLGADAVLLGRPYVYASILAGQAGVEQVIQHILADLDVTMGLAGWDSLDEVRGKGLAGVLATSAGKSFGVDDGEEEVLIKVD